MSVVMEADSFPSKWNPITFQESLSFVKKVKARDHLLYLSLFKTLGRKELTTSEIYEELLLDFQDHDDLLTEFMRFKPYAQSGGMNSFVSAGRSSFLLFLFLFSLFLYVFAKPS